MFVFRYTDPVSVKENAKSDYDITPYVIKATWSGDESQAARKLEFSIAYNTPVNDITFIPLILLTGGRITMAERDDLTLKETKLFEGVIFYRKRDTSGFTFEFTAYDQMIYLAKSTMQKNFKNITVLDAFKAVCAEVGIPVASQLPDIQTKVNFIADNKSGTEILQMLFGYARADTGKDYIAISINGKISIVEKGTVLDGYVASNYTNVISTEHSESIEDMVNKVKAVDDDGTVCQIFSADNDISNYGTLQKIYKMQPQKQGESVDNVKAAKDEIQGTKEESSLNGLGNVQCITGYSIMVQEEQLKGKFYIKSDTHTLENNQHTMNLSLEYLPDNQEESQITMQNIATPVFHSSGEGTRTSGNGSMNVSAGLQSGAKSWVGVTMAHGSEGCVEAAGKIGSYYSPFLATESKAGVAGVSRLVSNASKSGIRVVSYNRQNLVQGDVIVYGNNDHVVIYDGKGGYYGNSSSKNKVVHGSDYLSMGGLKPTKIIKTSGG